MIRPARRAPVTIGYARASTGKQENSIPVQAERIKRYVENKRANSDKTIPALHKIFESAATSGRTTTFQERPEGREIYRFVLPGDHFIVAKMDRLGRNTIDILTTIDNLRKHGVSVHIIDFFGAELPGTDSPIARLLLSVVASVAEFEAGMVSLRTKEALAELRRQGKRVGQTPRGYRVASDGTVVEDKIMKHWHNEMVIMFKGGHTYKEIAEYLVKIRAPKPEAMKAWNEKNVGKTIRHCLALEKAAQTETFKSTLDAENFPKEKA